MKKTIEMSFKSDLIFALIYLFIALCVDHKIQMYSDSSGYVWVFVIHQKNVSTERQFWSIQQQKAYSLSTLDAKNECFYSSRRNCHTNKKNG